MKKFLIIALILLPSAVMAQHPVLRCLPEVESEELRQIFADPWTLYYESTTMPRLTQHYQMGVVRGNYQFNSDGNNTNPNAEFPWVRPGGMQDVVAEDVAVCKFYWHRDHKLVRTYNATLRNGFANVVRERALQWEFAVDSVMGEILALSRNGKTYVIEVRTLTREEDAWQPTVFRQFNTLEQLANAINELGHQNLASSIGNLPLHHRHIQSNHSPPAIVVDYIEADLPLLPESVVSQLLNYPLREISEAGELTATVTQILPAGYHPAHVGVNRDDCLQCHRHVAVHAQFLDSTGRDWYSRNGGSGKTADGFGIFSLNPWADIAKGYFQ